MKNLIKRKLKPTFSFLMVICLFLLIPFTVTAETYNIPYQSYTYWDDINSNGKKLVQNKAMYNVKEVIDAKTIGSGISELVDFCTDDNGNIYMLDIESKVIILDSEFNFINEFNEIAGTENQNFKGAKSIYAHTDKTLYICDTENQRVLHCDNNGNFIDDYTLPDSPLIPENFAYRPIRVVADSKNYVYVLCEGSYYGALLYAPDKSFMGFYGANTVTNGILGAIQSLIGRMFPNDAKKSNDTRKLPFVFSDITIDKNDFIYTATDTAIKEQIKQLNPGIGTNILNSADVNFVDSDVNRTFYSGGAFEQRITGIAIDDNGFIYCLDSSYGRVFVYDSECRMLTAFGGGMGSGTQKGTFGIASTVAIGKNGSILVGDKGNSTITVFKPNDYGKNVLNLTKHTVDGEYLKAENGWKEVLKEDKNLQIAYIGLARAHMANGNYKAAMELAKEGYDRDTYALAYEYYRQEWLSDNFAFLFCGIVLAIVVIVFFAIFAVKKKLIKIKSRKTQLVFNTLLHPAETFDEIKEKNAGSVIHSAVLLLIFYVTSVCEVLLGGFLFTVGNIANFNSIMVFVRSVGLIVLWVVSNWLICTLLGGKGKLKEITVVTCYSLIPLIIGKVISTIVSNFILLSETGFLNIINAVAIILFLFLLIVGMLKIHDFTMTRFIGTSILTVLMMAAIIFLLILIGILFQQLGGFVGTLFIELIL